MPIPAISLSMEPANISAIANDVGTELIFLRQLIAQARPNDVAVAISTSGGSRNVVIALEEARKREMLTVALLGYDGGEVLRRGLADFPLIVRSDYIPRIQEVQASIYHLIREALEGLGMARLSFSGLRVVRIRARCASGWNGRAASSTNTMWMPTPSRASGCAHRRTTYTVPLLVKDGKVIQVGWQGRGCVVSTK